jgi:hypothetical protein
LFLESSSKLGPALALYESSGFEHRPAPRPGSQYARADIYMVWRPSSRVVPLTSRPDAASPIRRRRNVPSSRSEPGA